MEILHSKAQKSVIDQFHSLEQEDTQHDIYLVGLSGVGKSTLLSNICTSSNQEHNPNSENADIEKNGKTVHINTHTITGTDFDENGALKLPYQDTKIVQTFTIQETQALIDKIGEQYPFDKNLLNQYTLGIPKLIQIAILNEYIPRQIIERTAIHIMNHLHDLQPNQISKALDEIQAHFLSQDRTIPEELRELIQVLPISDSAYKEVITILAPMISLQDEDGTEARYLLGALRTIHPNTLEYYKSNKEHNRHTSDVYIIAADLPIPGNIELTEEDIMDMNIPYDNLGDFGTFLKLFHLVPNGFGSTSKFQFSGYWAKSRYHFQFGNSERDLELTNCSEDNIHLLRKVVDRIIQKANIHSVNYFAKAWDHFEGFQAVQMLLQEAVLQQLGVPYAIQKSNMKTYVFKPGTPPQYDELE